MTRRKHKETFECVDPTACSVQLVGDFTNWEQKPLPLQRQKDGVWRTTVALEAGSHEYRFVVDGQWRDDTRCTHRRVNGFGSENCVRDVAP